MTRATLLQVLARPTALGPAEVRELEQLAQAFPYCQTAHLLLAKAAHDQGTMLAGQRLRRAATYAADRALLRRLIEEVEPAPTVELSPAPTGELSAEPVSVATVEPIETIQIAAFQEETAPVAPAPEPQLMVSPTPAPVAAVVAPPPAVAPIPVGEASGEEAPAVQPSVPVTVVAPVAPAPTPTAEPVAAPASAPAPIPDVIETPVIDSPTAPLAAPVIELSTTEASITKTLAPAAPAVENEPELATEPASLPETEAAPGPSAEEEVQPAPEPEIAPMVAQTLVATTAIEATPAIEASKAETISALIDREDVDIPAASPALPDTTPAAAPEEEPGLPAHAPAIRPPVEAGDARFEFGLAEPPPGPPAYELPGLVDEWAAAAVTLSLGGPEPVADLLSLGASAAPVPPALTPAAFTGDETVGYGYGESSRLGFSMQLLNLLADKAEAEAAALPPAVALPPPGTFFEPDPLLLDHWAAHRPLPPALPSSLDLINNFLKRQPRLTRAGMLPPTPGGQTDLSVRSTRAEPDLVSENLARIFVRQGKTARAIEIYEKLMVKQPEKMAYFTAQIQSLQPSA